MLTFGMSSMWHMMCHIVNWRESATGEDYKLWGLNWVLCCRQMDFTLGRAGATLPNDGASIPTKRVTQKDGLDQGKEALGVRTVKVEGCSARASLIPIEFPHTLSCERGDEAILDC